MRAAAGAGQRRARLGALAVMIGLPGPALAHVSERAIVLLLPTDIYRSMGVLAVLATLVLVLFLPARLPGRILADRPDSCAPADHPPPAGAGSALGFAVFAGLIVMGLYGPHNPLGNLLPLSLFTLLWLCALLLAGLVGDFFHWLNPWAAPAAWLFGYGGTRGAGRARTLPGWVGYWPALGSYLLFATYYLSDIAPDDPSHLALAALTYWFVHFLLTGLYGPVWLARGEAFTLLFALAGRLAVLGWRPLRLRFAGSALLTMRPVPLSLGVFAVSWLAVGSFDGLNETFWWMARIGINPLEFPGRSAVIWQNRAGLVGAVLGLNLAFATCVWAGLALAGARRLFATALPRLALCLLPIALAYHLAHYLPSLLVSLQYVALALNDPLDTGARLLGLDWQVTTSFFNQHDSVRLIWLAQAGATVLGHVLSVLLAHWAAGALMEGRSHATRRALASQLFVAGFMLAYTWFGLWLLASPTAL